MSSKYCILLLLGLIGVAHACSPAQKGNIERLRKFFGIEPFYPNGELDTHGYTDDYIGDASELACNFNTDDSPLADDGAQKAATCKWKNMKGERTDIDDEQFYLFVMKDAKRNWNLLKPNRGAQKQTPAEGDGFALTGGKGRPAPQSVYYSAPIKCAENPSTLSFDYWIYSTAALEVLVLKEGSYETVFTSAKNACTRTKPRDGRCSIEIPAQDGPFHLAIHAYNLNNQFAIIDNIRYDADLGDKCLGGGEPFDFGTVGSSLPSRNSAGFITDAADLDCSGESGCQWANSRNGDIPFQRHTAPVDADKWKEATGDSTTPSGDFYMAVAEQGDDGVAELVGDPIECQEQDGLLRFRAWASEGTRIQVCAVDADTLEALYTCDEVFPPMENGEPFVVPVFGPLQNFRIAIRGSDWNAGNGGMVAVDDISYEAALCPDDPPVTTTTANPDVDICEDISTDFDQSTVATSIWQPHQGSSYQGRPLVQHDINPAVKTAQNTQVDCPDHSLCAGSALDKNKNYPITILETRTFQPLLKDRYVEMTTRRGTYGTSIFLCRDRLPNISADGVVQPSGDCDEISGPELTYSEYRNGKVTGAVLPKGTTQLFLLFSNPHDSGADRAGFLVDDIQLLRDDDADSGRLCEGGSKARK